MRVLALLFTLAVLVFGLLSLVFFSFPHFSFNWQDFLAYAAIGAVSYGVIWAVGKSLDGGFRKAIDDFISGKRGEIAVGKTRLRIFGLLMITLLPCLAYFLLFSVYAAVTFALFGFLLLSHVGRAPVALLIGLVIVALGTTLAMLQGFYYLVFPKRQDPFGIEVGRHEHPRLWQLLKDVSTQTGSRAIDKVVICPDAGIGVLLSGNLLKTMFGRGKRTLVAGIPSLHNLTVEQLRAILAHEYGHFSHRDTQWGSFTYVMGNSLLATLRSTPGPSRDGSEEGGWIRLVMSVNPAFWMLWVFVQLYFKVTQGFSRVREVLSDMRAIKLCGGRVFAESLMKVSTNDFVFSQIVEGKEVPALLKEGKGVSDLSEALESVFAGMNAEELNAIQSQLLQRNAEQEAFASHPTLKVRCDYSLRFPDAPSRSSEASVQGLFVDWAQLNQRIAALYNFRLAHLLEAWQKVASGAAAT